MPNKSAKTVGISLTTATTIVIASMVGTGVFTSLGFQLFGLVQWPSIAMLWFIGGIVAHAEFEGAGAEGLEEPDVVVGFVAGCVGVTTGVDGTAGCVGVGGVTTTCAPIADPADEIADCRDCFHAAEICEAPETPWIVAVIATRAEAVTFGDDGIGSAVIARLVIVGIANDEYEALPPPGCNGVEIAVTRPASTVISTRTDPP